jgi:hypothetical protein
VVSGWAGPSPPAKVRKVFKGETLGPDLGIPVWTFERGNVTWRVDRLVIRTG